MRIEQDFLKAGYFWLPENEKRKLPGTLKITDGGEIELEVLGLFDESIQGLNAPLEIGRVIGTIEKDGLVTLEDCFYKSEILHLVASQSRRFTFSEF